MRELDPALGPDAAFAALRRPGEPGIFFDWALSPDEQDLVVQSTDTLPLGFPYSLFPSGVGIWSVSGARVASVGAIPLPAVGGVAVKNVTIAEQTGYLVVAGEVQ